MNLLKVLCQPDRPVQDRLKQVEDLLSTADTQAQVELRHSNPEGRKVRSDSTQNYQPEELCLVVRFLPRKSGASPFSNLVKALEKAGEGKEFVSLKWFRDKYLPQQPTFQGLTEPERHQALGVALEHGIIVTGTISNPDSSNTTTISLNHSQAEVRRILLQDDRQRMFRPIKIPGGPVSQTVIEDRR